MSAPFVAALAVAVLINAGLFYRLMVGRTPFDRLLAAAAIGTNAVILLVLTGSCSNGPTRSWTWR